MLPHWRDEVVPAYRARPSSAGRASIWTMHRTRSYCTDAALDRFLKSAVAGRGAANGFGPRPTSGPYLRGFPTKAMERQAQLEDFARDIHVSKSLRQLVLTTPAGGLIDALEEHDDGRALLDVLQRYLDEYGHQIYNLDFVAPTMADDPLPALLSLKAAVEHPERDARARQEELAGSRGFPLRPQRGFRAATELVA